MWTIDLPLFVQKSAKKRLYINLNGYRNWHFRDQHLTKELFEQIARAKLKGIPKQEKVHLHYVLYSPSKHRRDLMNVIAIVDKYFSDALSKTGILVDDNTDYIVSVSTAFGGVDNADPRVSVTIVPVDCPMELNFK